MQVWGRCPQRVQGRALTFFGTKASRHDAAAARMVPAMLRSCMDTVEPPPPHAATLTRLPGAVPAASWAAGRAGDQEAGTTGDAAERRAAATERIARLLGWVVGALALVALLAQLGDVCLLVFAAVLIAAVLRGAAERLARPVGLSPGWALAGIVAALALTIGLSVWLRGPALIVEVEGLIGRLNEHLGALWTAMDQTEWGRQVAARLRTTASVAGQHIAGVAAGVATSTLGGLGSAAVVLATALYLAASPGPYVRGVLVLLPPAWRARGRSVLHELGSTLRWWFVGQAMDMLVVGTLTGIGLTLLGVPLAPTLAIIAGLFNFVPYIGALAGAVPAVMVAFGQGAEPALWVAALYGCVQALEGYVIAPLIQRRTVSLPPVLTILSQTVLGTLFGPMGLILATPLTAAGMVTVRRVWVEGVLGDRGAAA